jgi:hypothetical protein
MLAAVQRGTRPIRFEILEILCAAGRQVGGEIRRRCVVLQVAPGIGADEAEPIRVAPVQLQCESVISGSRLWRVTDNVRR